MSIVQIVLSILGLWVLIAILLAPLFGGIIDEGQR
jgi:hypothetical protein